MTATIQKWGNSQGVRLPKSVLADLNMREGQEVDIIVQDDAIILKTKKRKTIQELFEDYHGDYRPEEMDWGAPSGREVW